MANNLTGQVRNIAEVTTAVATATCRRRSPPRLRARSSSFKNTINVMVDQLSSFGQRGDARRPARSGTEGKLGGRRRSRASAAPGRTSRQRQLHGVNLTSQVRNTPEVTTAVATGDLSKKITASAQGGSSSTLPRTPSTHGRSAVVFASEVTRVAREVGTEGKLGGQAEVKGIAAPGRTSPTTSTSWPTPHRPGAQHRRVTTAVATGRTCRRRSPLGFGRDPRAQEHHQRHGRSASFLRQRGDARRRRSAPRASSAARHQVKASAHWKDLTDQREHMASNLTSQVRNIRRGDHGGRQGDLSKKITVDVKGRSSSSKNTINTMVDQLSSFASEVTRVRPRGRREGKLAARPT